MIRVGLVGFGLAGRVFHAPLISSVEGLELAAVVERHSDQAAERYPGLRICRSLEELLNDTTISLVVLATPPGTHLELGRRVLSAGRNLVIDKPMAPSSAEIAELIDLARSRDLLLAPFQNRRWDADFRTVQKLVREASIGRLVHFASHFDRWRPAINPAKAWKSDPNSGGGVLLDLGTHLVDQAMLLFGKPDSLAAEVGCEREGEAANDNFDLRLYYPGLTVALGANCLASLPRPRFHLRGTRGNFIKFGVDQQENELGKITRIDSANWGEEPSNSWGTLSVDLTGAIVTRPVASLSGNYRVFYRGVADAIAGQLPTPVSPADAWRTARILEWALRSAKEGSRITCDWQGEPSW